MITGGLEREKMSLLSLGFLRSNFARNKSNYMGAVESSK